MQNKRTIKIFLGSSITELHDERVILGDYLMNSVRPIFKQDGIEIEVCKCEDIRSGNTGRPPQNKIDTLLRGCDVSVFMFKCKAGDMTVHEFDVARKLQKRKRHEIYVYCFNVQEADKSQELKDFQDRLIKEPFYWYDCKDVTDLESQFVLGLLKLERQLLEIKGISSLEQETAIEKDGDALLAEYKLNEQKQVQLRKKIHQNIDGIPQQIKTVMENGEDAIAAKIFKVIELFKKADRWAAATDYDKEKYSDLLFSFAGFLYHYGLYRDAKTVFLRQIDIVEELYGKEDKKNAMSYNNIGLVYYELGDFNKALEYHFKALAIQGTNHPDTAISYNNIGMTYNEQGNYAEAIEYYLKALKIKEKNLGTNHPDTATSYNNIATSYNDLGDYKRALEYCLKALKIRETILGTEHPDTAQSYYNTGEIYRQIDREKALEYHYKALKIQEKVLGPNHPDAACSHQGIGLVHFIQGDYDKALKHYFKALAIQKKVFGTMHPSTAFTYDNIGLVFHKQDDYDRALEYYFKALKIKEMFFGTEHPDTATSYNNIGGVFHKQGNYSKALEYLDKAYQIYKKKLGPDHPHTKNTFMGIIIIKKVLGSNNLS